MMKKPEKWLKNSFQNKERNENLLLRINRQGIIKLENLKEGGMNGPA